MIRIKITIRVILLIGMRWRMKRIVIVLLCLCCLWGCSAKAGDCRVVTGVQVEYTRKDGTIFREYTSHTSMQSVLTYLRILKPYGPVIPQGESDTHCRITLHFSHGPDSVYVQQGQAYLQKDGGDWASIDASRASLLYPLLLLLPSDGVKNEH